MLLQGVRRPAGAALTNVGADRFVGGRDVVTGDDLALGSKATKRIDLGHLEWLRRVESFLSAFGAKFG